MKERKQNIALGKRFKSLRVNCGLTQKQLAEKVGITPTTLSRYEQGYIDHINTSMISKFAEIFGVSPVYLLGVDFDKEDYVLSSDELDELTSMLQNLTKNQIDIIRLILKEFDENNKKF